MEPIAQLDQPRTHARINIQADVTARELEHLIHQLAEVRAQMQPAVAPTFNEAIQSDSPVQEVALPSTMFRPLIDGGMRLWFRHQGIGWLALRISKLDVTGLRELVTNQVPNTGRPQ